jgi:hypothetical protein
MPTRRELLVTGFVSALAATSVDTALARKPARVVSATRRDETIRNLGGLGDGYKMTLRPDGSQLIVVNDGPGWTEPPRAFYTTRVWQMGGRPAAPQFAALPGYPSLNRSERPPEAPHYYGHGLVQVGNAIYQFLGTLDHAEDRPRRWTGAKLIYSTDNGATWRNQDGSTPVVWEEWKEQTRERLAFFEPDGCFSLLTILQYGAAKAGPDGFVHVYGLNGSVDGRMNELVLFRARPQDLTNRQAYNFFAGHDRAGRPRWSADIAQRQPVHTFPRGWVNSVNLFPGDLVVESWLPSVVYNAPLGVYMMSCAGIGVASDGTEFGKPSYFGLWVSDQPTGPWRQIHEDKAWTPGGDPMSRAYAPQIAPGWIAPDGRSFWLVWPDLKGIREFGQSEGELETALAKATSPDERAIVESEVLKRFMPGFSFNMQRIDLTLA